MRPQGISNQQAVSTLRVAFEKYIAQCQKQGRLTRAALASTLYRARFDAKNYQTELERERQSDTEIISALQSFVNDPTMQKSAERDWAIKAIRILSEERR